MAPQDVATPVVNTTAPPTSAFYFYRGVKTLVAAWVEYNTGTCKEITSGKYTINREPKFGKLTFGTITGKLSSGSCTSTTYTFGAAYYTWTNASQTATKDEFAVTWKGNTQVPPEPLTLIALYAPVISGPNTVWWFDGAKPSGFVTSITLTAEPTTCGTASCGPYHWKVVSGANQVKLSSATTSSNTVTLTGVRPSAPKTGMNKIQIEVTEKIGGPSHPLKLTVLEPYKAVPKTIPPDDPNGGSRTSKTDTHTWYISHLPYEIVDQFGKPLGKDLPLREHFTSGVTEQCANCNWLRPVETGSSGKGNEGVIVDTITGQTNYISPHGKPVLAVPQPDCPTGNCGKSSLGTSKTRAHCYKGEIFIGDGTSTGAPKGVRVMEMIWQRFEDHARHCNILSPTDGSGKTIDACTCVK